MNKYIKMFMDDHNLKVGDEFRAKGLNIDKTWHFDENGYLIAGVHVDSGNILSAFLLGEWEVEKVEKRPWKPKEYETYYFTDKYGDVVCSVYNDDDYDRYIFDHKLVFQTKEEAEDYKWFLGKMDEYKKPFQYDGCNYYFGYHYEAKEVYKDYNRWQQQQGTIYFGSLENIDKFLGEVGEDRIKKYWFKVEEGVE